jgi:H+/Cl- antiporter ClcA
MPSLSTLTRLEFTETTSILESIQTDESCLPLRQISRKIIAILARFIFGAVMGTDGPSQKLSGEKAKSSLGAFSLFGVKGEHW